MLHPVSPGWAHALPGYGPSRVLVDGALTPTFDEWGALVIALAWVAGLLLAVGLVYRRTTHLARPPRRASAVGTGCLAVGPSVTG
jgi:hypothetical protein